MPVREMVYSHLQRLRRLTCTSHVVPAPRFELGTSCTSSKRLCQLGYAGILVSNELRFH